MVGHAFSFVWHRRTFVFSTKPQLENCLTATTYLDVVGLLVDVYSCNARAYISLNCFCAGHGQMINVFRSKLLLNFFSIPGS